MITYQQLVDIPTKNLPEKFVDLPSSTNTLEARHLKLKDMILLTGDKILVRKSVKNKLIKVAKKIQTINSSWKLLVAYGYRSPEVQTKYFIENAQSILRKLRTVPSPTDLYELIHQQIAVPCVAGHPTGGAVDVCLTNQSSELINCGSKIYDLNNPKRFAFYPLNIKQAKVARNTLRKSMLAQGFAPYDGEWWHFSYGDKEWAAYYKKPQALYGQVNTNNVILKKYVKNK